MSVVDQADDGSRDGGLPVLPLRSHLPDRELDLLMAAYQGGDYTAATGLIERISPQLHRYFMGQFSSRRDADDLLQETWMRIHKVRHTYRPGEPVLPWFYSIARRVKVDHYRKAARIAAHEEQVESISELGVFTERTQGDEEMRAGINELLAPLPQSQREVIFLLKVAEMTLEDVARATSSTIGSVKQKAHRGYATLRERLGAIGLGKGRGGGSHER
jgi:RNA polymerase sigma-70 factor (ECF subfamily)